MLCALSSTNVACNSNEQQRPDHASTCAYVVKEQDHEQLSEVRSKIKSAIYDITVPLTTRKPREDERHGFDYNFVSRCAPGQTVVSALSKDKHPCWDAFFVRVHFYSLNPTLSARVAPSFFFACSLPTHAWDDLSCLVQK